MFSYQNDMCWALSHSANDVTMPVVYCSRRRCNTDRITTPEISLPKASPRHDVYLVYSGNTEYRPTVYDRGTETSLETVVIDWWTIYVTWPRLTLALQQWHVACVHHLITAGGRVDRWMCLCDGVRIGQQANFIVLFLQPLHEIWSHLRTETIVCALMLRRRSHVTRRPRDANEPNIVTTVTLEPISVHALAGLKCRSQSTSSV